MCPNSREESHENQVESPANKYHTVTTQEQYLRTRMESRGKTNHVRRVMPEDVSRIEAGEK
jgi:hypothetical protein